MCHADDSRPPAPAGGGEPAGAAELTLTSADGTGFMAYHARPQQPSGVGVVILPDVRGLHEFYKSFARRLAGVGHDAVGMDYYGRLLPAGVRDMDHREAMGLVPQLGADDVAADVRACVDYLRTEAGCRTVFTLGFCYGGGVSWAQSASGQDLAGCIGFYGSPMQVTGLTDRMTAPLLVLAAGADTLTSQEQNAAFDAELTAQGIEHGYRLYDGAPHAFFDAATGFDDECADAWQRVLAFIDTHSHVAATAAG